jgi:large subunit ribosomal protein L29
MADKKASAAKLREQTPQELQLRLEEAKKEMFSLRVRQTTKELENPHAIRTKRREIARILTVLHQKSGNGANG